MATDPLQRMARMDHVISSFKTQAPPLLHFFFQPDQILENASPASSHPLSSPRVDFPVFLVNKACNKYTDEHPGITATNANSLPWLTFALQLPDDNMAWPGGGDG